jgi:hypothetical protein
MQNMKSSLLVHPTANLQAVYVCSTRHLLWFSLQSLNTRNCWKDKCSNSSEIGSRVVIIKKLGSLEIQVFDDYCDFLFKFCPPSVTKHGY